jgi:outer membrane protein assembly factor BamB
MRRRTMKLSGVVAALIAVVSAPVLIASADNWPGWRGPDGTGHSQERDVPVRWSATESVRWKTPLPGPGMSSPIVWGDRVFLTQALDNDGRQRGVLCFDRKDGRLLWQKTVEHAEKESSYSGEPHFASGTPVTDGERVIAAFGSAGVVCYDFQGKQLWRRDLGKAEQIWGNAISPILHGDRVILNFGPGERTFLIALDKKTGQDVWKVDQPGGRYGHAPSEWIGSWSVPVVLKTSERDELIVSWPEAVKAYNPKTGELLWTCRGLGPLVYSTPLVTPEAIVAMSGFGGPYLAVKPGGKGDVTDTHRLWHVPGRSPQRVGSGIIAGEHVYILNAIGTVQSLELKTGKTLWEERASGASWSSMVHADGRLYVTDQKGETLVLAAKPVLEILARNPLGERSQSSPAISNGEVFIRTYGHLWCIGGKR